MNRRPDVPGVQDLSFSRVFTHALRGEPCRVMGLPDSPSELPVHDWTRCADRADDLLLDQCRGHTLDIGCGPGRLTARLAERGLPVLGIDVVPEAVRQTCARGVEALRLSVFDPLPREGGWDTALLADGNIGISGDPETLVERIAELLAPRGRVVVELAAPGVGRSTRWVWLEAGGTRSRPFRWSVVGVDGVLDLARATGFAVTARAPFGAGRWLAVLERRA